MARKKNWLVILAMVLVFGMVATKVYAQSPALRITERDLVGIWELENTENIPRNDLARRVELFDDGTGVMEVLLIRSWQNFAVTWQLRNSNRLQTTARIFGMETTEINDIELRENGTLLIFHYSGRNYSGARAQRAMYRKR